MILCSREFRNSESFGFALRFLRVWPILASLALGDTKNVLISNAVRPVGLVVAIILVVKGGGGTHVAGGLIIGELLGLFSAVARLAQLSDVPVLGKVTPIALSVGILFGVLTCMAAGVFPSGGWCLIGITSVVVVFAVVLIALASPSLSSLLRKQLGRVAR